MDNVSSELLEKFKRRMHFSHSSEDDNLEELLSSSIEAITDMIGPNVDIDTNAGARGLVIERARYAYNDSLEFFLENFSKEISTVQLKYALDEQKEEEENEIQV